MTSNFGSDVKSLLSLYKLYVTRKILKSENFLQFVRTVSLDPIP